MPTFPTPDGVLVTVNLPVGDLLIIASDRSDTEVVPHGLDDPSSLRVRYEDRRLVVDGPPARNSWTSWLGFGESIQVRIDVPEGATVNGVVLEGGLRGVGRLGECTFRTDCGEIALDRTGPLKLTTDSGDISVKEITGHAEVTSDSGVVQIRRIDGSAGITSEYGETEIGEVTGDLRLHGRDADLLIGRTHGVVDAYSDSGDIRVAEVVGGSVSAASDSGNIEISLPEDADAVLDLRAPKGTVHDSPREGRADNSLGRSIAVQAQSHSGDVSITRFKPKPFH
ncbi:DUF4097 family beta strand repeat-containing protein [Streptomyces sp. Agncl-13]|uniref:DUF4097 family beta strand repeat-containing protein n=1 Tax=Streptomyces sp. Agncl-13 TaxID=3400628 RepID=UPI003A84004D